MGNEAKEWGAEMTGKTRVVVRAKDGRQFSKIFESYEAAKEWISANTTQHGIDLQLEVADFKNEPTFEVYTQKVVKP